MIVGIKTTLCWKYESKGKVFRYEQPINNAKHTYYLL